MKLSIIIPIYNVEQYIPRCLSSIYSQCVDESEFEVIAVIDGSPDDSSRVVGEYADVHNNLCIVEQENAGVSCARNNGIRRALGDYLMFVDPDDALRDGSLSEIMHLIGRENDKDLIICKSFENDREIYEWNKDFENSKVYTANQVLNSGYVRGSVWGGIYNREFILSNNILFVEGMRNGEDTNFNLQVFFYSNSISFCNIDLYQLIGREGSASRVYSRERIDAMIASARLVYALAIELCKQKGNHLTIPYMCYSVMSNLVNDSLKTPGVDLSYLVNKGISKGLMIGNIDNVKFLRGKMIILKLSFRLFYVLNWIKNK